MKYLFFYLNITVLIAVWLVYQDREQELMVQHEYLKACDATRMYLENLVEKNGIKNELK